VVSLGGLLGSVVMGGFGAVFVWNGWTAYTEEQELVNDAVDVTAEITNIGTSETQTRVDVDDGGSYTKTEYVPQISFEYTYSGETYTASNLGPPAGGLDETHKYSSESRARSHLDDYEQGGRVTAYVDPDHPGGGFLEKETNTVRNLGSVVFGAVFILLGIVFFGYSLIVG